MKTPTSSNAPPRKTSTTAAQLVVMQSRKKAVAEGNVQQLPMARLEQGTRQDFTPFLTAIIPQNGGGEPYRYELDFMLAQPHLYLMFGEAFIKWAPRCEHSSRAQNVMLLRGGFFAFLGEESDGVHFYPHQIDDQVLIEFRAWLCDRRLDGKPLHPATVTGYLGSIREPLGRLDTGPFAKMALSISQRVPSGPAGANARSKPVEILSYKDLINIIKASEREVQILELNWEQNQQVISEGKELLENGCTDLQNFQLCLAMLDEKFTGLLPNRDIIKAWNPSLWATIERYSGAKEVSSYFYPSARILVGIVILITISAVLNPDSVLTLRRSMIDRDADRAGSRAIKITAIKKRAHKNIVRLLDPQEVKVGGLSLDRVLIILEKITQRIRGIAGKYSDWAFIFVPENRAKRVAAFQGKDGRATNINWQTSLSNFRTDNGLTQFTLVQLRATLLDMVQMQDGSLEAAAAVGNHGNVSTTWKHYTHDGVKKRNREKIGEILVLRDRWIATSGKIDPRRLMANQDKAAATPGFLCLDVFNPPNRKVKPGVPCDDFGACPDCPLAVARPSDAVSVAYYLALRRSFFSSQSQMNAKTWLTRWAAKLRALNSLIAQVPEQILREALLIRISLPDVG